MVAAYNDVACTRTFAAINIRYEFLMDDKQTKHSNI